jgi:hypothetical protein
VGTVFFLAAAIACATPFFLTDPAKHGFKGPHSVAIVGGGGTALFALFALLSIYTLIACFVENISIAGTLIRIKSVFQTKQFDASSIKRLDWNERSLGGKLILRSATNRAVVRFHDFANADVLEIIRVMRRLVPEELQHGWPAFCHHVAMPLRDGDSARQPGRVHIDPMTLPESGRVFVTRRRYDVMFGILLVVSAAGASFAWWMLRNPKAFALLLYLSFFWALLRFSTPKHGKWSAKWTATTESKFAGIAHLSLPIMFVAIIACKLFGIDPMIVMVTGLLFLLGICVTSMRYSLKREKEQRTKDKEKTDASVLRWNGTEAAEKFADQEY